MVIINIYKLNMWEIKCDINIKLKALYDDKDDSQKTKITIKLSVGAETIADCEEKES